MGWKTTAAHQNSFRPPPAIRFLACGIMRALTRRVHGMHSFSSFHRALRIASLACFCTLAACGWRLQGTARLPEVMAITYIDTEDRFTDFNQSLRENLSAAGATLTERRADATAIVQCDMRRDINPAPRLFDSMGDKAVYWHIAPLNLLSAESLSLGCFQA